MEGDGGVEDVKNESSFVSFKQSTLESLKLQVVPITGDGNCQYSAISYFVFDGDASLQMEVRRRIHKELCDNPERYIESFAENADGDEDNFQDVINNVLTVGAYGNNITLFAASNSFQFDYGVICREHVILSEQRFNRRVYFDFDGSGIGFDGHYCVTCPGP